MSGPGGRPPAGSGGGGTMLGPSLPDLAGPGDRGGPGGGVLRSSDGKDGTDTLKG